MKTITKITTALAATAALALAGGALAQSGVGPGPGFGMGWGMGHGWAGMGPGAGPGFGGGPGWGMGHGMMGGGFGPGSGMRGMGRGAGGYDMAANAAGHLAALKTQLKITPAQEGAWKAYESTITQQAAAMQKARDQFHAQWQDGKSGAAAPDFAAQHQAMSTLREQNWQARNKAVQDLYAALTPEQQALVGQGPGWMGPRGQPRR
jgi:Spy/CpxP family protein refolding chaperone